MIGKTACVISSYVYIYENINYGALLQYYALEKALDKCGIKAYWLRYCPNSKGLKYEIKRYLKRFLNRYTTKKYEECLYRFLEFLNCYCRLSSRIYWNDDDLYHDLPIADYYITGSDQVWGGTLAANYLEFVPDESPKISYAASFGKTMITDEHKKIIKPWLERFCSVSVREDSGVEICKSLGVEAWLVLDPTLLIDSSDYPTHALVSTPDIYCYFLNFRNLEEDLYWNRFVEFSTKKGFTIEVACTEKTYTYFDEDVRSLPSPKEWLSKYANAKYIITNTFHGTVFAIIFHKKFLVLKQNGESAKQNGRMESLLKMLNLENRFFDDHRDLTEQIDSPIRWEKVDSIILKERDVSFQYIKNALAQ